MPLNPQDFLSPPDYRESLSQPFNYKHWTVYTDSTIFLVAPGNLTAASTPDKKQTEVFEKAFSKLEKEEFRQMPKLLTEHLSNLTTLICSLCNGTGKSPCEACPECQGEGFLSFINQYNSYFANCQTCDGEGYVETKNTENKCPNCYGIGTEVELGTISINGAYFNQQLLKKINAPDTSIFITNWNDEDNLNLLCFQHGDSKGLIMGMRKRGKEEIVLAVEMVPLPETNEYE